MVWQVEGAFTQGFGMFCLEEMIFMPSGALLTRGPSNYKLPALGNTPRDFRVSLLVSFPFFVFVGWKLTHRFPVQCTKLKGSSFFKGKTSI